MTWYEQLIILAFQGILHTFLKNPATLATVQKTMIEIANDIYAAYGMTPPTPAAG